MVSYVANTLSSDWVKAQDLSIGDVLQRVFAHAGYTNNYLVAIASI